MIRYSLAAAASALALAACSTPPATNGSASGPAPITEVSAFDLAMSTSNKLVSAGNTQTAIDRLTQLTGDPSLTREELAATLLRRAELRMSEQGFDLTGAIDDFEEIINTLA